MVSYERGTPADVQSLKSREEISGDTFSREKQRG